MHSAFTSGLTTRSSLGRYTSRLEIGVSVFFVISGFLLYRPFALAHLEGRPASSPRAFWARRLRRIVPAYWLAFIVITYVLGVGTVRHDWWSPLVYLGFAQIYSPHYVLTGVTQAWSLCTEMSFYLLLPVWAALVARAARRRSRPERDDTVARAARRRSRPERDDTVARAARALGPRFDARRVLRTEVAAGIALVVVGEAFRAGCLVAGGHAPLAGRPQAGGWSSVMLDWLPAYLDLFGVGMLLAVASAWWATTGSSPRLLDRPAVPWASWALAAGAFAAVSNMGLPVVPLYHQTLGSGLAKQALYGAFAVLLVAPAVFGPQDRSPIRSLLRWRPIAALGVVSYGIYLWHQAWIGLWMRWTGDQLFAVSLWRLVPFVVVMAVVAATASWWGVERWVIRRPVPWRRPETPAPRPMQPASPATLVHS